MRLLELIPTPEADPALMRDDRALLRSAPGQRRRPRQGHAELHRQPHRHLLSAQRHAPDAGDGPQHRRSRRAHRHRRRLAEDGDLPTERSGRPRHSRPRRAQRDRQHQRRAQRSAAARLLPGRCWSANGWATKPRAASTKRARAATARASASRSTGRRSNTALRSEPKLPALEMAKNVDDTAERLRMLLAPVERTKPASFLWSALSDLWTYSANRIGEIADSVVEIDRAMKLGFNWEFGPFELWDAAGVAKTVERMKKRRQARAANVEKLLASGKTSLVCRRRQVRQRSRATSILAAATTSRRKFPPASGQSRLRKSRTAW